MAIKKTVRTSQPFEMPEGHLKPKGRPTEADASHDPAELSIALLDLPA